MQTPSVCYRMFNYGIDVGVRAGSSYSDAALAEINPYQSLGPQGSKDAMNEIVRVKIPVAVIIMHRLALEPVYFYKHSEMLKVYKWIREHLSNWLDVIRYDYIRKLPPLNEMFAMEELCAELYPHLVGFYGSEFEQNTYSHVPDRVDRLISILGRKVSNVAPVNMISSENFMRPYSSIMEKIMELRPNG